MLEKTHKMSYFKICGRIFKNLIMFASVPKLKEIANTARYPGDEKLQTKLLEDGKIKRYIEDNKKSYKTSSDHSYQLLLSHCMQVTQKSSPYLFKTIDRCTEILDLRDHELSVFIDSNRDINAWCRKSENRVTIGLNSGLIDCMEFEELCFIVGHEFGHAFYNHHLLPAYGICQDLKLTPSKLLTLMSWSRQSEISADRAGMLCADSLDASVQALIKLSTGGLGKGIIAFDVDEFEKQLDDIDSFIDENSDLMYTTHPLNPFRVRALIEFSKLSDFSNKKTKGSLDLDDINLQIDKIIEKMNPSEIKAHNEKNAEEKKTTPMDLFMVYAGYWVLSADREGSGEELASLEDICGIELVDSIKPVGGLSLDRDQTYDEFKKILDGDLKKLKKSEKCTILETLVSIARADGEISKLERAALDEMAVLIDMDVSFIDGILKFLD
ncbi:MAG: hypothetical protein CMP02_06340 [Woeseiaceae bacterium]|nr:hypothetical protein [Woeseiaceae bacterium]